MSMKSLANGIMLAAVTSAALLSGQGSAEARDWRRGPGAGAPHGQFHDRWEGGRGYGGGPRTAWRGRHHDNFGRNVAIGAFAAVVGAALLAQSARVHDDYYDERD